MNETGSATLEIEKALVALVDEIRNHKKGSLRDDVKPLDQNFKEGPICIGLAGYKGVGKSAFVNSCKKLLSKDHVYRGYALTRADNEHGTMTLGEYPLTKEITLFDNRGLDAVSDDTIQEVLRQNSGHAQISITRKTDVRTEIDNTADCYRRERKINTKLAMNVVIFVVSVKSTELEQMKKLIESHQKANIPYVVALTNVDNLKTEEPEQKICEEYSVKLGVSESECFPIVNDINRFQRRNLQHELQLAMLLKEALFKADQSLDLILPYPKELITEATIVYTKVSDIIDQYGYKNILFVLMAVYVLYKMFIV